MAEKTYTARQVAERYNVAGSTVRGWLLRGVLPGAFLKETELGGSYWLVPESTLKNFVPPKPGPAPKANGTTKNARSKK
jgi:transposase